MLITESKYFHLWLLYSLSDLLLFSKRRQESELTGEFYRLRGSGLDVKVRNFYGEPMCAMFWAWHFSCAITHKSLNSSSEGDTISSTVQMR